MYYPSHFVSSSYDWTYLIIVIALLIISMIVQSSVSSRYKKYDTVRVASGLTGAQAAQQILEANGVTSTRITTTEGKELSDYYNPKEDTIYLTQSSYNNASISAIGVACHEAGHAIQYAKGYGPVKIRMACIPICNIASKISIPIIIAGLILSAFASQLKYVALAGIILFAIAVFVQFITLPVEFDASNRAIKSIRAGSLLDETELKGAKSILQAAAMTYVVATVSSIVQLLRFISLFNRR